MICEHTPDPSPKSGSLINRIQGDNFMSIMKTVVLAYSGGLDTSVCIPLLKERYDYDKVITVVADVGQPASRYVEEGGRNQYKDPRKGLAKDVCDKSSLDNIRIIGGGMIG